MSIVSGRITRLGLTMAGAAIVITLTAQPAPTIEIDDYFTLPISGHVDGTGQTDGLLARVNGVTEEPGGANRLFIHDLNGSLFILDKSTKVLTTYLDFNGRDGRDGLFQKFSYAVGYANGLLSFAFDPAYRTNGRFYTVHIEEPAVAGATRPDAAHAPGLSAARYETTTPIKTPGEIQREAVLIEWTDTNIKDATFTGTAREILRVQLNARIHPLSALTFNPMAKPGDPEWRVLYIGCGDGGSGESRQAIRSNPQRLDTVVGKILRIVPDPAEHASSSDLSENRQYRIPRDNPFVGTAGARKEIWAYGFRNPHRLTWIQDAVPNAPILVADSVGLYTWETINIVHKGANYGYSQREGNQLLQPSDNRTTALPQPDQIPVRISDTVTDGTITPTYPVIQYPHKDEGGDAIGAGFAYRGSRVPALRGTYIFSDISTGRVWYADIREMLAADDAKPETMATMHRLNVSWAAPGKAKSLYDSMFPIAELTYHARGGKAEHLPGMALVSAKGRADAQLAVDASGELYILTKSDGTIRAITGATIP